MDLIALARQLGHAIQEQDFYKNIQEATKTADNDKELQDLIGEFNLKRMAINNEACKEDRDEEKLKALNEEMRDLYAKVMANDSMKTYNNAKTEFDTVMQRVIAIISQSAEGQDPDTTDFSASCAGDCSSCGGCH